MSVPTVRVVRAFAPGHVTGVFRPDEESRDPRGRGSVGSGIVLELGVHAEARFTPGATRRVRITANGTGPWPISLDVARRLAPACRGTLAVHLRHDFPVGQGFGMSAAGALATALAVGRISGTSRARSVSVAHLSDLFGGGGLGGVPAILGGGLETRLRPGIPPLGRVVRRNLPGLLWVGVVGEPIPSPTVLRDRRALERIRAASQGWERAAPRLSPEEFFRWSERFTDRAGLASARVRSVVEALRARGSYAAQAMFGESFFAYPRTRSARVAGLEWLRRSGVHVVELGALPARAVPRARPGAP